MSTFIPGGLSRDQAWPLLLLQDVAMRSFSAAWPAPRWIKIWRDDDPLPRMAWMNTAFSTWWDVDPRAYMGQTDDVVWPPDELEQYLRSDREAIDKAGEIITAIEHTQRGRIPRVITRKFAFPVHSDGIKGWGIYGEICPLEVLRCDPCPNKE